MMTSIDLTRVIATSNARRLLYRGSIRRKLVLFVAALVILTTLAVALGGYLFVRQLLLDKVRQGLTMDVATRGEMLQAYIQQQHERIALVASRTKLRQLLQGYQEGTLARELFQDQSSVILHDARRSTEGFLAIWITDPAGRVITATHKEYLDQDYVQALAFQRGRQGTYLGLPEKLDGGYRALVSMPALANDSRELGVVIGLLDIKPMVRFLSLMRSDHNTAEILLGTLQGRQLHYLFPAGTVERVQDVDLRTDPAMAAAIQGHRGFMTTHDYRGGLVLAAYQPVGYQDWGLVAKIDRAEAYAPIARLRLLTLLITAVVLLIALMAAYAIAGQFTRPILALSRAALAISGGQLETRAQVESNDEVGLLGVVFNDMAVRLQQHRDHLEELVTARTAELEQRSAELRRSQEALEIAKEEAEQASRAKGEFLANMSHEIRTPLNGVIGMTELLGNTPLTSQQREYLDIVMTSADTLLLLINDILDFSKIEAGKLDLEAVSFNLRDTVGDTLQTLAIRAAAKGLELAYHIPPDVPATVVGDPIRLRQILVNLVGNAIKFTPAGEVVVEVRMVSSTDTTVGLAFAVRDTGIGIPPDKQQQIFNAFDQVDRATTRHYGGTGLGLTISSQLTELMGGRMWVESDVGRGSTFSFTAMFAVARQQVYDMSRSPSLSLQALPVLVVDDNRTNRQILTEMLCHWGMRPTAVSDGQAALAELERAAQAQHGYPLALLDMMIPEMDGFELAGRIRRTPALSGIRLLILSSAGYPDNPVRNQELDITQCLIKPVKQSELLHAITNALGLASIVHTPREQGVASRLEPILPRHILLAEDGLVNQKVVIDMLTQRGHTVVVANHGKEALEALEHAAFDLILMDVHMPEMDGFEATAAIRAKERTTGTHIPIIAITASAMKGDRERCLAAGMDGYLAKPMHAVDLYRAVEEIVPRVAGGQKSAPATTAALINASDTVSAEIAAVLDWKKALEQFEGNEAFLLRMVHLFLVECPKLMIGAREAMAQENVSELRRIAHILKGSADMFAAQPTGALALRLETLVQEGTLADVEDAWHALEEAITRLLSVLSALVRRERA